LVRLHRIDRLARDAEASGQLTLAPPPPLAHPLQLVFQPSLLPVKSSLQKRTHGCQELLTDRGADSAPLWIAARPAVARNYDDGLWIAARPAVARNDEGLGCRVGRESALACASGEIFSLHNQKPFSYSPSLCLIG